MDKEELIVAYKVITQLMDAESLGYDNSFVRVKNWLANKICNFLIEEKS